MAAVHELIEAALAASRADDCIVVATEHSEANLRWAANSLTTNGLMRTRSVTVVSVVGDGQVGVVSRSVTTPDELAALVRDSETAARSAAAAEDAMPLVDGGADPSWEQDPAETSIEVFDRFARELGSAFRDARSREELLFGFAEHSMSSTFVASSTGLRRRVDQPAGRLELNAKSPDFRRSAYHGVQSRDFTDVDVLAVADLLRTRLQWASTSIDLPAGRYETILPPSAVADLIIDAYWAMAARDAEEGRSVYSAPDGTRIGQRLSDKPLTLFSDPSHPGLETADFEIATSSDGAMQSVFDNGDPLGRTDWIRDGVLTDLVRTRSWAQQTGAPARHFTGNLILEGSDGRGGASLDDMVAATERGLLLTCLWYIREVDPQTLSLTGLTRDGVYLVEDGAVQGAVNNFRFNESPVDLLGRVSEVGRTQFTLPREMSDYFTRVSMPPLRVPDFFMSTVSPAS